MKLQNFIKTHPLTAYFVMTFVLSWSGILIVSIFTGMPAKSKQFETIAPYAMLPLVIAPTLVSLLLTAFIHGKSRLKTLLFEFKISKTDIRYYLAAFLTIPVIASAILFFLSQYSSDYIPKIITTENKPQLILTAISAGVFLTLFEEVGWTGFATPELTKRYSIFKSGLFLGMLWGLWHFLPVYYGCGDEVGKFNFQLFYPGFFFHYFGLIPFRTILIWLYKQTKSIFLPWIMHATLTSCTFFILNISKTGFPLFVYYLLLSIALWICVAAIHLYFKR